MNEFQVTGFPDGDTFFPSSTMTDDNLFLGILFNGSIVFESTTSSTTPYQVSIRLDGTEISNSGTITSGIVAATGIPIEHRTSTGYFTVHILSDDNITFQSLKWQLSKYVQANYLSEGTMYTPDYTSTDLSYPPNGSTEVSSTGNYRQQTTGNLGATTSCPACTPLLNSASTSYSNDLNACASTDVPNSFYFTGNIIQPGVTVYTDVGLSTIFVGNSGHYRVDSVDATRSIQINSLGVIINSMSLCP
jgi:hypothetical protein